MNKTTLLGRSALVIAASLLSIQMAQAAVFQIKGVANWDSLNMRSKAGAKNPVVGKIPANGKYIRTSGKKIVIGKTSWVHVTWQGKSGWVSERYIQPMKITPAPQAVTPQAPTVATASRPPQVTPPAPRPVPTVQRTKAVAGSKGQWVLECGNMSPFWKVIVHPKALEVNHRGQVAGMLPITYEKQERNRWNTAKKTVLRSSNGRNQTDMTITYTKQCFRTLTKQNVHYSVKALVRGEQMNGCCRAVRIK